MLYYSLECWHTKYLGQPVVLLFLSLLPQALPCGSLLSCLQYQSQYMQFEAARHCFARWWCQAIRKHYSANISPSQGKALRRGCLSCMEVWILGPESALRGGSALLPAPTPPILLEEKEKVTKLLASRGATIQELNTIRKALSLLKGGGLARAAYPAQVLSLILSDVIGNPVDIIASGPTVYSSPSVQGCLQIMTKYNLMSTLPRSVETVLSSSVSDPSGPKDYSHVYNVVIGSNSLALEEAKHQAEDLGYWTLILSAGVCGEVSRVAKLYSQLIQFVCLSTAGLGEDPLRDQVRGDLLKLAAELEIPGLNLVDSLKALQGLESERWVCLLAGGETTVQLQGNGKGGRNQELALQVALELHRAKATGAGYVLGKCEVLFLSGGTDGQDGPTEAAGAFSSQELVDKAAQEGLDVETFLSNNDSYTFFSKFRNGHHLLLTGLTGTNVMDIQAILIRARNR
nr:glycerate kinase isoform X2 [Chelonoidis abingdonii]